MRNLIVVLLVSISALVIGQEIPNLSVENQVRWELVENLSDEFDKTSKNTNVWQTSPGNVGVWTWDNNNLSFEDGVAGLKAEYAPHTRMWYVTGKQTELYFKSAILKSKATKTYGYYEASIKGAHIFPGVCPAFWLYSNFDRSSTVNGHVVYSEIDIVELQQRDWYNGHWEGVQDMDLNLHCVVRENGAEKWKRPKAYPSSQMNKYKAPWDPRDDFHTYAIENRPDSILWYVDGVQIAAKKNKYWHRPMNVTLSMGMRSQFVTFKDNNNWPVTPTEAQVKDFPTTMEVEYVRTWNALPSLWVENKEALQSDAFDNDGVLEVELGYHAGSGFQVKAANGKGLVCQLQEIDADGQVVKTYTGEDATTIGGYAGKVKVSIDLKEVAPTASLPSGHYYALSAHFTSSKGNGQEVNLAESIDNITIEGEVNGVAENIESEIVVYPNPCREVVFFDLKKPDVLLLYNMAGALVYSKSLASGSNKVDLSFCENNFLLVAFKESPVKEILIVR